MAQITKLNATTELEAVNAMLAALGEAPIADFDGGVSLPDVQIALNTLRDAVREVQSMGWKFNTEFGYQLSPALTYAYKDKDGTVTGLNVFLAPPRLIKAEITQIIEQMTPVLDLVLRPARSLVVTVSGADDTLTVSQVSDLTVSGAIKPRVFYDRVLNRDGLDSGKYDFLYIDPVWLFDFEDMPEVARRFSLILAMRRFLASQAPSVNLVGFSEKDQGLALRNLKVEEGQEDDFNMLDNTDVGSVQAGRRPGGRGFAPVDPRRKSPGKF